MPTSTNKLKALRLERAWSQEQLAELPGLSTRIVQRIENVERSSLEIVSRFIIEFGERLSDHL
ncbi:helix-turn-helix transcriptional regulator [Pectobacterium polaris]|uniref:helix-turn-helix transcriptional regulator n=1 Tax=Pectobacterium polaris TaxID=2042057 RepID=UPI00163C02D9